MQRFITAVLAFVGLSGSAKVARHIGNLEKIATKLSDAVDQINNEIGSAAAAITAKRLAFEAAERQHYAEQGDRQDARDRALRVALRVSGLVS